MRLRAGLRVLRRAADEVQVGTDPRWAVRLTGLAPDEVGHLVTHGLVAQHLAPDEPRLRALADDLALAGLAVRDDDPDGRAADDVAWGLLRPDDDPTARSRRRAAACVGVVGLGATGVGVAVGLAAAGVGTVPVWRPCSPPGCWTTSARCVRPTSAHPGTAGATSAARGRRRPPGRCATSGRESSSTAGHAPT